MLVLMAAQLVMLGASKGLRFKSSFKVIDSYQIILEIRNFMVLFFRLGIQFK